MKAFDHIAIIYNPGSTGDAPRLADKFHKSLKQEGFSATLSPTKHAEHAIEIARKAALKYKRPLLISVSGDGGYNEVIRGAMEAKQQSDKARPVTAVIAAGNANDHKRVTRGDTPLLTLIRKNEVKTMDVLEVTARAKNFSLTTYAHSYVGLGVTPLAGDALNKQGKSLVSELRILFTTYAKFVPFPAEIDGRTREYNNIIFGNINEMAKVVKLHESVSLNDGKFEVIKMRHHSNIGMVLQLIYTAIFGVKKSRTTSEFTMKLPKKELVQLDGEIIKLPAGTTLTVRSIRSGIESLY